jgi:hypothetical protein
MKTFLKYPTQKIEPPFMNRNDIVYLPSGNELLPLFSTSISFNSINSRIATQARAYAAHAHTHTHTHTHTQAIKQLRIIQLHHIAK